MKNPASSVVLDKRDLGDELPPPSQPSVVIELTGPIKDIRIRVWVDGGARDQLKHLPDIRAAIVDALRQEMNFIGGVQ